MNVISARELGQYLKATTDGECIWFDGSPCPPEGGFNPNTCGHCDRVEQATGDQIAAEIHAAQAYIGRMARQASQRAGL